MAGSTPRFSKALVALLTDSTRDSQTSEALANTWRDTYPSSEKFPTAILTLPDVEQFQGLKNTEEYTRFVDVMQEINDEMAAARVAAIVEWENSLLAALSPTARKALWRMSQITLVSFEDGYSADNYAESSTAYAKFAPPRGKYVTVTCSFNSVYQPRERDAFLFVPAEWVPKENLKAFKLEYWGYGT